jgi:hypothetical protein
MNENKGKGFDRIHFVIGVTDILDAMTSSADISAIILPGDSG